MDYLAVYFDVPFLPHIASLGYRGVEVADWGVARSACVEARSAVRPGTSRWLLYTVLRRQSPAELPRFAELVGSGVECPPGPLR